MKKVILAIALVVGGLTTYAQETEQEDMNATSVETEVSAQEEATAQDDFSAIDNSELPEAVSEAFTRDFPNAEITKAYVNQEGQYKLDVTQEDGSSVSLYADSEGNWLDM
jgi:hypothetical protein